MASWLGTVLSAVTCCFIFQSHTWGLTSTSAYFQTVLGFGIYSPASLLLPTPALYKTCLDSLDQVYPVVDGGPVEECNVFFVWLPNIETRLYQLSAALEDAVPGDEWRRGVKVSSHTNTDKHRVKYIRLTHSDKMHTRRKTFKKQINKYSQTRHPNCDTGCL